MLGNMTLMEYLGSRPQVADHAPWPRFVVDERGWRDMLHQLAVSDWVLLSVWAEPEMVHVALADEHHQMIAVVSLSCPGGRYPALTPTRPAVLRLERAIRDLYGLQPVGLKDDRPWLDHGHWPQRTPLGKMPQPPLPPDQREPYSFLPSEGEGLHHIPVGPVHAGVIEPGHFRFTCAGETVVRMEERLGYLHRGIDGLLQGATPERAAKLVARLSGDSTVALGWAFAQAVEAASGTEAPLRAVWLRALLAEMERLANHLFDIGAVCNDAAFAVMLARCMTLREQIVQTNAAVFGHRLLMDRIIPGGLSGDLSPAGAAAIRRTMRGLRPAVADLAELYDSLPNLLDRTVGTGRVKSSWVRDFAAGGFVGRAAGRRIDLRRLPGYSPYENLGVEIADQNDGDVNARLLIRFAEAQNSLDLIEEVLDGLPDGPVYEALPPVGGEGLGLVESFRGDLLIWLRLSADGQRVERCHVRDPSWFQWPLLESCLEGNIVADFPLCNKSFNCSYAGVDL